MIMLAATAGSPSPPPWPEGPISPAAALQELLRAQPNFSLAWIATNMPFKHDADRERYMEAFRRAGLK